jgi:uncharacterized DUF497 family protein
MILFQARIGDEE